MGGMVELAFLASLASMWLIGTMCDEFPAKLRMLILTGDSSHAVCTVGHDIVPSHGFFLRWEMW